MTEPAPGPEAAGTPTPAPAGEPTPTPTPAATAPAAKPSPMESSAVARVKGIWAGFVRWLRQDAKRAIRYAIIGMLVSWLGNVIVIAAVYNGVAKVPPGAGVTAPSTAVTGILFWTLAMALVFGAFSYARTVGSKRFWADVRGFPNALVSLFRSDGAAARVHLLWGFAGAMLVAAALSGGVAFVIGITWLALLAAVLRPVLTGLLMFLWRKVVGAFSKQHGTPPPPNAFAVSAIGIALALVGAYVLPTAPVKVTVAIAAGALAFILSRSGTPAAGAAAAALIVGVVTAWLTILVQPALGHDGGFSECGGSWAAWFGCSGTGEVVQNGLLGGFSGAAGSTLGGGLGDGAGKDRIRRGWGATFDGGFDGFTDQLRYLGERDVADPLSILAALGGAPDEALVTDSSRAMRDFMNSGEARSLYEEFAADPLKFANDHGISDWVRDFPTSDHGMNEQAEHFKALYDEYQRARAAGDDYNANRLRGMLGATTIWLGAQFIEPETAVEGAIGRFGTRKVAGSVERVVVSELGAAERATFAHIPGEMQLNAEQRAFLERNLGSLEQIVGPDGKPLQTLNQTHRITFEDGGRAILKPESGVGTIDETGAFDGPKWSRELGTYVTDQHLGFGQVPTTAVLDHPELGRSSAQAWREGQGFAQGTDPTAGMSQLDIQRMAVRDFVTGESDRHFGNVLQAQDGSLIAIDHGESFPNGTDHPMMRNEFVGRTLDQPLDPQVVAAVQGVDRAAFRQDLLNSGLTARQADAAVARLDYVAANGRLSATGLGTSGQTVTIMSAGPGGIPNFHQVSVP